MGQHKSKFPLSYEEACKRITADEFTRIEEAFKRWSSNTGYLPQVTFQKDVITDAIPGKLAEDMFMAFQGSQKGIGLRDLIRGIVLLTHGEQQEKMKFVFSVIAGPNDLVTRKRIERFIEDCGDSVDECSSDLNDLFITKRDKSPEISEEVFLEWLGNHLGFTTFTQWLLGEEDNSLKLTDDTGPASYHQTIATLARVSLQDVMALERRYWYMKTTPRFELELLTSAVSPPVPKELCKGLFAVFDENGDGHIDFPEFVSGVAACCCRTQAEHFKFCFKIFDEDGDGKLSWEEFVAVIRYYLCIEEENRLLAAVECSEISDNELQLKAEALAVDAASGLQLEKGTSIDVNKFIDWSFQALPLSAALVGVLKEVCHVVFGLRPTTPKMEAEVISGYLQRAAKDRYQNGGKVYLIEQNWWENWKKAVNFEDSTVLLPNLPKLTDSRVGSKQGALKTRKSKSSRQPHQPSSKTSHQQSTTTCDDSRAENTTRFQELQQPDQSLQSPTSNEADSQDALESAKEATTEMETAVPPKNVTAPDVSLGVTCENDPRSQLDQIDNSCLCEPETPVEKRLINLTNEGGKLRSDIVRGVDYEFISEEVWRALTFWYRGKYGREEPALPRHVEPNASGDGFVVELYPLQFLLYKHTNFPPQASKNALQVVWATFCTAVGIGDSKSQPNQGGPAEALSQPTPPSRVLSYRASFGRNTTVKEIITKLEQVLRVVPEDLRLHDFSEEEPRLLDFEVEGKTVAEMKFGKNYKLLIETRNRDNTWPEELIKAVKEAKVKEEGAFEDASENIGETKPEVKVTPGVTGMSNLGNTCFMNSAVQCVSNTEALTGYFRNKSHLKEINKDNPLGMGGAVARRYGDLVSDLWKGAYKSIVPLRFRFTIARCAPQFAGFQQQDAQELLAFLLDGLHEDLNRVHQKVYRELKDSDGRPNQEVANEAWSYHIERNQSIIVDLFNGQLKSELRCLKCGYVSMRFDPFTFLSLPLPLDDTAEIELTFVPMDGTGALRYLFRLDSESKYTHLREELSKLCGVSPNNIMFMEVAGGIIRSLPPVTSKIRTVLGGWLFAYEVPSPPEPKPIPLSESIENITRRERLNTLSQERQKIKEQREKKEDPKPIPLSDSLECITVRERLSTLDKERKFTIKGKDDDPKPIERSDSLECITRRERLNTLSKERETGTSQLKEDREETSGQTGKPTEEAESQEEKGKTTQVAGDQDEEPILDKEKVEPDGKVEPHPEDIMEPLSQPGDVPSDSDVMSNNCFQNFVVGMHRRVITFDGPYFLAISRHKLSVFGLPVVVPCQSKTNKELYASVWKQTERLISKDSKFSQRLPGGSEYPFELKMVSRDGLQCERCPWYKFCQGCRLECNDDHFSNSCSYLAIDWDPTTLHLRYQYSLEKPKEHESVQKMKTEQEQPIGLNECLKAFTKEEKLGEDDPWYCKQCQEHQTVAKKLEIWRLPPILIVHVKRFQFFHSRWIKSQRTVTFPTKAFNPVMYRAECSDKAVATDVTNQDTSSAANTTQVEIHQRTPETDTGDEKIAVKPSTVTQSIEEAESQDQPQESVPSQPLNADSEVTSTPPANGQVLSVSPHSHALEVCNLTVPPDYDLYAVTTHYGVLGGGHYIAFAKNPNGTWYHYNDSSCRETTEERVQNEAPYLLFYQRRGFKFDDIIQPKAPSSDPQTESVSGDQGKPNNCSLM